MFKPGVGTLFDLWVTIRKGENANFLHYWRKVGIAGKRQFNKYIDYINNNNLEKFGGLENMNGPHLDPRP